MHDHDLPDPFLLDFLHDIIPDLHRLFVPGLRTDPWECLELTTALGQFGGPFFANRNIPDFIRGKDALDVIPGGHHSRIQPAHEPGIRRDQDNPHHIGHDLHQGRLHANHIHHPEESRKLVHEIPEPFLLPLQRVILRRGDILQGLDKLKELRIKPEITSKLAQQGHGSLRCAHFLIGQSPR